MSDEATALKPCPFCGQQEEVYPGYHNFGTDNPYEIDCLGCGVTVAPRSGKDAIAAWNRRAVNTHDAALSALRDARRMARRAHEEVGNTLDMHFDSNATGGTWQSGDAYDLTVIEDEQEYAEAERMIGFLDDNKLLIARIDALLAPEGQAKKEG